MSDSIKECVILPILDYKGKVDTGASIVFNFNHTGNIDSDDIKLITDYCNYENVNVNVNENEHELNVSELFKNISIIYNCETVALNTNVPYLSTLKHKITEKHEFNLSDFFPKYHFNIMNDYKTDKKLTIRLDRSFVWARCNSIKIKYKCDESQKIKNDLPHFDSKIDNLANDTCCLNIGNLPSTDKKLIYLVNQIDNYRNEQIDLVRNNVKYRYYHNDVKMENCGIKGNNEIDFDYGFNRYKFKIPDEVKEKYKNIQLVCYYCYLK